MKTNHFMECAAAIAAVVLFGGCAMFGSKEPETQEIAEEELFSPIRAKYTMVSPSDLPVSVDALRIAVVDVSFDDGLARMGFRPGLYRPRTGFCQLLKEKTDAESIAALVKAIDPYVDRMPFGVLFTYGGRATSDPAVSDALPAAYTDFFQEFQTAMRAEDIDFVCLLPEKVTFLK